MLLQLIIIQLVTFVAIVFVLRKLLYTESAKESMRLKELTSRTTLKQKELQEKIDAAGRAYKDSIEKAEEEVRRIRAKLEQETEAMKKSVLAKAKADADHIIKSAFNAREKMREEIALEMHKNAPILASRILQEVLSDDIRDALHRELVKDVIASIKKTQGAALKTKDDKGEVSSARLLKKSEKLELESLLSEKTGHGFTLREKDDPRLIAGVIIKIGDILIDGSLTSRLKQARERIEE